ncbi:MAG: HAMP domain-containing sensor histidine kinase [Pricia sp.]
MSLRAKITAIFILLTGLFQIVIFVLIYFFYKEYTESEFYLRLKQRATIAAQAYLEKDEVTSEIYESIRLRHLQTLPDEKEALHLVDTKNKTVPSNLRDSLPEAFVKRIFRNNYAELKIDDVFSIGLLYEDNQGDFMILLSARDLYGTGKLKNLRNILVVAFLVSMIFIAILGRYFAKQALSPISEINKKVNVIRAENLNLRLEKSHGKGELADLTNTFNNMLDRLETSFETKSSFVQNASHELKNPLTAIIGQTEVALTNARTEKEYILALQAIETEANRLNDLLNSLFRLAYADQDSAGLEIVTIRADELLLDLRSEYEVDALDRINYSFRFLPDNSDELIFKGSHELIKIALTNILDNALKYSKNESVDLDVRTVAGTILISIKDFGIGISENDIENVFEPFYRGSNARKFKGFGFGLSLANKIIRLHGGEMKIHSKLGQGTLVEVKLPNISSGYKIVH